MQMLLCFFFSRETIRSVREMSTSSIRRGLVYCRRAQHKTVFFFFSVFLGGDPEIYPGTKTKQQIHNYGAIAAPKCAALNVITTAASCFQAAVVINLPFRLVDTSNQSVQYPAGCSVATQVLRSDPIPSQALRSYIIAWFLISSHLIPLTP